MLSLIYLRGGVLVSRGIFTDSSYRFVGLPKSRQSRKEVDCLLTKTSTTLQPITVVDTPAVCADQSTHKVQSYLLDGINNNNNKKGVGGVNSALQTSNE